LFNIALRKVLWRSQKPNLQKTCLINWDLVNGTPRKRWKCFFEEIRKALESGEQVKLSGFGNFDLRDKNERPGRNPKTGEDIPISARRVVTFRPGQKLKARVENIKVEK
jgi:integration host factor subunit alpha